jgi:tetratricopeptide (TPR) repeat protein
MNPRVVRGESGRTVLNTPSSVRSKLAELMANGHITGTLDLLRRIEQERGLIPSELVTKGRCLQLAPIEAEGDLTDAEKAFQEALNMDPEYVPALVELAYFYDAVLNDSALALPLFDKAIDILRAQITEAAIGKIEELRSEAAAATFLRSLRGGALILEGWMTRKRLGWGRLLSSDDAEVPRRAVACRRRLFLPGCVSHALGSPLRTTGTPRRPTPARDPCSGVFQRGAGT